MSSRRAWSCLLALLLAGCAAKAPVKLDPPAPTATEPAAATTSQTPGAAAGRMPAAPAASLPSLDDGDNIFFRSASTQFEAGERRKLLAHAQRLKGDGKLVLVLIGHTDDQGSRAYNLAIAEGRVDAVFQALRGMGIPARQLQRYPVGEEKAGNGCATAECRVFMRRVELVYRQ